jgi:sugar transferase (PEP-CTERM/EpsH1 system associated)
MDARLVAHIVHRLDYGGLENGLLNIVNHTPPDRFRHAIICLSGFNPEFRGRIRRDDVEVISIGKRPGKDPAAFARVWRELRRLRPAVVHTRNIGTMDMQWMAFAAGVRCRVHGEHGWEASDLQGLDPRKMRVRRACRPVIQHYVAVSQDIARWLEREWRVPRAMVRQIYNGVDSARFSPAGPTPGDLPWPAAGDDASIAIGTVGRLDRIKNQESLVVAVAGILARRPELRSRLRLVVVGDGPMRDELHAAVGRLGVTDIAWLPGARSDVPDLMRAMDVFVLPSLNEGISNTILEAMASGLPVVATRTGGNPELVKEGQTGRLYAGPEALEEALLSYIGDPQLRATHGRSARDLAVREFSLERMIDRYLDLYDSMLLPAA